MIRFVLRRIDGIHFERVLYELMYVRNVRGLTRKIDFEKLFVSAAERWKAEAGQPTSYITPIHIRKFNETVMNKTTDSRDCQHIFFRSEAKDRIGDAQL